MLLELKICFDLTPRLMHHQSELRVCSVSHDATSVNSHDAIAWITSTHTMRNPSRTRTKSRRWPSSSRAGSLSTATIVPRRASLFHATQFYHPRPARSCKQSPLEAESTIDTNSGEEATATILLVDRSLSVNPWAESEEAARDNWKRRKFPFLIPPIFCATKPKSLIGDDRRSRSLSLTATDYVKLETERGTS